MKTEDDNNTDSSNEQQSKENVLELKVGQVMLCNSLRPLLSIKLHNLESGTFHKKLKTVIINPRY